MMSGARGIRRITAVLAALVMAVACLPLEAMAAPTYPTFSADWFKGTCAHHRAHNTGTEDCGYSAPAKDKPGSPCTFACSTCREVEINDVLNTFQTYEVESSHIKNPELVKVNLFDYWVTGQFTADSVGTDLIRDASGNRLDANNKPVGANMGINNNHLLKFVKSDATVSAPEAENSYTNSAAPYQGIVQNKLFYLKVC